MSDEATEIIVGDSAIDALTQPPRRSWFRPRRKPEKPLTRCENCEAPLAGPFCAQCGQHAIDYRRSFMQVVVDAADSFFDWDTKFLRSLGILLTRPGKLTIDFNAGRRVRYMHPLRFYFLASIAFFLLAKLINFAPSGPIALDAGDRAEIDTALTKLVAPDSPLNSDQRARVEELRARLALPPDAAGVVDRARLEKIAARLPRFAEKKELKPKERARLETILADLAATPTSAPKPAPIFAPTVQFDNPDPTKDPFGAWLENKIKSKVGEDGTKAQLFLDTLRSNIPTMMLFCIPVFAFILKMLYAFQGRYYIEHLVYALHIHAFAYMATVVITLLGMAASHLIAPLQPLLVVLLSLLAVAQVFVSIRRVYAQGWFFTTLKFFLGSVVYFIVLTFGIGATAFVTLLLP